MSQDYRYLAVADARKPRLGRRLVQPILYSAIRALSRTSIEGLENLPRHGSVILIYNHIHAIDPFVTVGLLPRYGVPMSKICLLYTSPSPRDRTRSRMPSSA